METRTFEEWMARKEHKVDERQIDMFYDKAHIAVELVNEYDPDLLSRVSTIANLASGAYGLYNSGEANKELPPDVKRWLIYRGVKEDQIGRVPQLILKKWGVDPKQIEIGDTIHVNVRRILSQSKNDIDAVLQIGSTIVHEATHEKEREFTGTSSETGPKIAEQKFMQWASQNMRRITGKFVGKPRKNADYYERHSL